MRQQTTNRLALESSPYLRQHAANPVDWFPWGPEALARSRELDRPIFLSIGYSACHWCHVMEHESFENDEIAQFLNENFVCIKVDREERPDLDQIYMTAVQLMTGSGGWPMSVFLTPALKPFFGGTYFPPDDRYGRPGFKRLVQWLAQVWDDEREKVELQAGNLTEHLQLAGKLAAGEGTLDIELLRKAVGVLGHRFDPLHGGFGQPPKFLHTMDLRVLLRAWKRFGWPEALHMARHTLDKMARGGIYDHLGGGFARYSTDARWLVPHFEKMLYDNALLTVVYLEAYQASGDHFYRDIVVETLDWVRREMTSAAGPFYSTLDADSDGVEGKFYVWTAEEIEQALGKEEADLFAYVYDVQPRGNWEGHTILNRPRTFEECATDLQIPVHDLRHRIDVSRRTLFDLRAKRVRPGLDDKMLTAWNGLMITAFARAAQVLDDRTCLEAASRAADFILTKMRAQDGRLLRSCSPGKEAKLNAYLEDYAYLLEGLIALYEATFDARWLRDAVHLAEVMIDQFWDAKEGGFFFTGKDHETLIARNKDPHDNATPSANAVAVTALFHLARLTGRSDFQDKAEQTMGLYRGLMQQHPTAVAQMLLALDFHLGPVQEFAIVGDPAGPTTHQALRTLLGSFRPNKILALKAPDDSAADELIPLLSGKTGHGDVTTYICRNFTCQAPVVGVAALEDALRGG